MIRLSIIVPFYNVEPYIEQCIRSLYDQDIPQEEYEVICVDDCSPDGSRVIVERLQKEYPTLKLICHERNKKQGGARNTGLKAARGEYIWFVDSDDYVLPNVMGELLREAETTDVEVLQFCYKVDTEGELTDFEQCELYDSDIQQGSVFFYRLDGLWWARNVNVWMHLYQRDFLLKNEIFFVEDIMFEDNSYAFHIYSLATRVKHVVVQGYCYRYNPKSVTHETTKSYHIEYLLKSCLELIRLLPLIKHYGGVRMVSSAKEFIRNTVYRVISHISVFTPQQHRALVHNVGLWNILRLKRFLTMKSWIKLIILI